MATDARMPNNKKQYDKEILINSVSLLDDDPFGQCTGRDAAVVVAHQRTAD